MKLLVDGLISGVAALESDLPAGVRLLQRLASGTLLVDATDAGARTLQRRRGVSVSSPGTASISPPSEFETRSLSDMQSKIEAAKARRFKPAG